MKRVVVAALVGAALVFAIFVVVPVPAGLIEALGGEGHGESREGGMKLVWRPASGDLVAIERTLAARGHARVRRIDDALEISIPGVSYADSFSLAKQLTGRGISFHEVIVTDEMRSLGTLLGIELEKDRWSHGTTVTTDHYLRADTRPKLEAALGRARDLGWALPAGSRIAFEHVQLDEPERNHWRIYVIREHAELDGTAIANARVGTQPDTNRPTVEIELDADGKQRFHELTRRLTGKKLAILLDGVVAMAPIIQEPIPGGRVVLTPGHGTASQQQRAAGTLAAALRIGTLPPGELVSMKLAEPADDVPMVWLGRLLFALGGGAIVGAIAWLIVRRR